MERNTASIYAARRQLTEAASSIDSIVTSVTTLSVASAFFSASTNVPVYTAPGQHWSLLLARSH